MGECAGMLVGMCGTGLMAEGKSKWGQECGRKLGGICIFESVFRRV